MIKVNGIGIVYKIEIGGQNFVSSTTKAKDLDSLRQTILKLISYANNPNTPHYNRPISIAIRQYGVEAMHVEVLEQVPIIEGNTALLELREGYYKDKYGSIVSGLNQFRSTIGTRSDQADPEREIISQTIYNMRRTFNSTYHAAYTIWMEQNPNAPFNVEEIVQLKQLIEQAILTQQPLNGSMFTRTVLASSSPNTRRANFTLDLEQEQEVVHSFLNGMTVVDDLAAKFNVSPHCIQRILSDNGYPPPSGGLHSVVLMDQNGRFTYHKTLTNAVKEIHRREGLSQDPKALQVTIRNAHKAMIGAIKSIKGYKIFEVDHSYPLLDPFYAVEEITEPVQMIPLIPIIPSGNDLSIATYEKQTKVMGEIIRYNHNTGEVTRYPNLSAAIDACELDFNKSHLAAYNIIRRSLKEKRPSPELRISFYPADEYRQN